METIALRRQEHYRSMSEERKRAIHGRLVHRYLHYRHSDKPEAAQVIHRYLRAYESALKLSDGQIRMWRGSALSGTVIALKRMSHPT